MHEDANQRLEQLRRDFEAGQHQLQQVEQQAAALQSALLRISGAIQVLEELLTNSGGAPIGSGPESSSPVLRVP